MTRNRHSYLILSYLKKNNVKSKLPLKWLMIYIFAIPSMFIIAVMLECSAPCMS